MFIFIVSYRRLTSLIRLVVRSAIFNEKVMVSPMIPSSEELVLKRLATAMIATHVISMSDTTWLRISMTLNIPKWFSRKIATR